MSLGDSEQQVRYVLGEPNRETIQDNGSLLFAYSDKDILVLLAPNSKTVKQIGCQLVDTCPPFLGIKIGDDEEKVKTVLGDQATERYQEGRGSDSSVMKVITLSNTNEVSFYLERTKVIAILLSRPREPEF